MFTILEASEFDLYRSIEFVIIIVLAIAIITLVAMFFIRKNINYKRDEVIRLNCTNVRIYTVDFRNKTVRFFDRANMSNQRLNSIDYLFNQCDAKDRERFIHWISSYEDDKENISNFFTVSVKIKKSTCLSIYRVTSYNSKDKILHLENTLLPGINAKMNSRKSINYIVSKEHLTSLLKSKRRYQKDCTVIYLKLSTIIDHNGTRDLSRFDTTTLSMTSIYEPLDSIYKYLSKDRLMCFVNDDEVAILDFTNLSQMDLQSFCKTIHSEVARYIDLKALGKMYYLSIGCAFRNSGETDIKKAYAQAKNMCFVAERLKNEKTAIYGVHSVAMGTNSGNKKNDIDNFIKNKTFKLYFTPVLSYDGTNDSCTFVEFKPFGTSFKEIKEAIMEARYHHKLDELLETLISSLDEHLLHYPNFKCVMSTSIRFVVELSEALNRHKELKDRLYLSFTQTEIEDLFEADYVVEDVLKNLKRNNIKTVLDVVGSSLNVPGELLGFFSFFTVSLADIEGEDDSRKLSTFISTRSILEPYKKEIFAINLKNESEIEMTFNLGYRQFVCKSIANVSSAPYIPEKGWLEDLEENKENEID